MKEEEEGCVIFSTAQKLPSATETFGTFFGPSQPCISRRVIKEGKAFMEEQLTKKPQTLPPEPAVTMDVKLKVQTLKKNRDYSCLLSEKDSSQALSPPSRETPSGGDKGLSTLASRESSSTLSVPESNRFPPLTVAKKPALIGSKKVAAHRPKLPLPHTSGQKRKLLEADKITKLRPLASDRLRKMRPARDDEEGSRAISMIIRNLFRYDPNKYAGMDSDDRNMEASFHDILKEENRSAKLAREEDKREQLLLEAEEKQGNLRKEAKRHKVT